MTITESTVRKVLQHPYDYRWTVQGFGMMRTYLDPDEVHRLHIWDTNCAVPDVSVIHDHPWDFDSRIYSGTVINQRYRFADEVDGLDTAPMRIGRIKTGEGGGLDPASVHDTWLAVPEAEEYLPGDSYHMDRPELHESIPSPGAVTIISRKFYTARDDQFATVCWAAGAEWVTAEPRPATREEIEHFIKLVDL